MLLCAVTLNWRNLPEEIKIHPRVYVFIRAFQRFSNSSQTIFFKKISSYFGLHPHHLLIVSFTKEPFLSLARAVPILPIFLLEKLCKKFDNSMIRNYSSVGGLCIICWLTLSLSYLQTSFPFFIKISKL